ncbi:MAG: PAS domain S-box protein, partial [Methanoregula sp.]|nr:PAS domain S-box protein [Methanoregula sp.]
MDITERKRAEEALRESEETFKALAENANDGILVAVAEGTHTYANRRAGEITGYSVAELLKTSIKELATPNEIKKLIERLRKRLSGEDVPHQYETLILRKDGKNVPIEITAAKTVWHGQPADLVIFHDITERKRAEEALRDSEENFRSIFENNSAAMAIIEPDTTISMVNEEYCNLSGYTKQEVIGMSWTKQIPPEDLERLKEFNRKRLINPNDAPDRYEFAFYKKNGEIKHALMSIVMIQNKKMIASFIDITERKRAEEALRESESFNRGLVENLPDYIAIYGPAGNILHVNPASATVLGYSEEKLVGTPVLSYVAEEYRDEVVSRITDRREGGEVPPYEIDLLTHGGLRRSVIVKGTQIQYRDTPATLLVLTDITERKRVEEELIASQSLLNTTLDSIPDIIGIQNIDHTIVRYNRAGYEFLHLTPEEVHGRKCYELIGRTIPCEKCATEKALKTKRMEQIEKYLPEYGIHLDCRSSPVLDKDGEIVFIVEQLRDITDRKRAEEALRQANKQLNLLSEITRHDILNQLLVLRGYLELSHDVIDNPEALREFIKKEQHAANTIDEQITFTRDYQNLGVAAPAWQNVNECIRNAMVALPLRAVHIEA